MGLTLSPHNKEDQDIWGREIVKKRGKLYKHYLKLSENACLRMSNIVKQSMKCFKFHWHEILWYDDNRHGP